MRKCIDRVASTRDPWHPEGMSNTHDALSHHQQSRDDSVTAGSAVLAVVGLLTALFGVYWDEPWHTDRGRDNAFGAPHLTLYAGVALAVAVVVWWGWQRRSGGIRGILTGPIGLAVLGTTVVAGSAVADAWWHAAFGRDSVVWSPPHMLGLVGTIALGTGIVLVAGRSVGAVGPRAAAALAVAAGVGAVSGWQVLVLEYDTDVPQFSPVWYLPVLAVGLTAGALAVQASLPQRLLWPATWVGLAYTAAMGSVIAALGLMDLSGPIVPVILPAMVTADITRRRGWTVIARSGAFVAAVFVVYVPYLRVVSDGVPVTGAQAAGGAVLGVAAAAFTIVLFDPSARWGRPRGSVAAVTMALVSAAVFLVSGSAPAQAHDPGQGEEVVPIRLAAQVTDQRVDVTVEFAVAGPGFEPTRVIARRSGRTIEGPLSADAGVWIGRVQLDEPGRWFVYVEALAGVDTFEAWLPVDIGDDRLVSKQTGFYLSLPTAGPTVSQVLVGGVLVMLSLAIVGRIAWTVRGAMGPLASRG